MNPTTLSRIGRLYLPCLLLALSACAPAPIYPNVAGTTPATPAQVAQSPQNFANAAVLWGGQVVQVTNQPDHSDIEILGYPLDSSQRPQLGDKKPSIGRFIVRVPGYVESMGTPPGAPITVSGTLAGSSPGRVGEASYVYPVVQVKQYHVWSADEMSRGHPHVSFGVGVGVGIH